MMRSLFSGVSGLKAHQTGMDVIGNNIANVNTTGFKSSRATFADMFSQTLTAASGGNGDVVGGTNPKQVGLGATVASIDLLFTDGSTQSTGKNTDMALQGNGLFIVRQGKQTYYTRNGDFQFDASGNFVNSEGLYVQGWTAKDGVVSTNDARGNIQLKAGTGMPAQVTSTTTYTSNLNASAPKIISMSVLDGNGNTIKVTGADSTWSVGTSQEPSNIENEEVTFSGNVVIKGAAGQYAMGKNYSVDGNRLASVTLTDGDVVTGLPDTVASLSNYAVGNTLPTAISSISGTAVTYADGSQIANSSNTYTVTLSDGSTVTSPTGAYTSGSAVSSSVATLSNTGVTLANGDTFTGGSSSFTITLSNGDVLTNGAATYSYTVGSAITPTVANIVGNTVTLSDGSTIAATTPANYTVGQAVPATVGTIAYASVPTVASITAQNTQTVASQTKNAITVMLSNGDTVNVPKTSTTQYTVDSAVAAAINSINTASGTAVTFKDGAAISNSNSTYTITLNNGDTIKIGGTVASTYTRGSSISSTNSGVGIQSVKGATVTLGNGDTLTNNSGTTYKATLGGNGGTLTISAASSANYMVGTFPNTVTVKSISGSQVQLSDGSVITSSNVSQYTAGQAVPTTVTVQSFTGLPTSSVSTITADDAPTVTEISGAVLSDDGTYDDFDVKTSGAYVKPSAGLTTNSIILDLENGSEVTVSSSDNSAYKAANQNTGDSGTPYTAVSPKSITLTMSDGSTVTETTGSYNVGYSMPVATTMKVYDKLGNEHNITLYFTKVATGNGTSSNQGNTWRVSVNADGGNSTTIKESDVSETTVKMDPVQLKFNPSGTVESGSQQQQTLTLQNGAESPLAITIDFSQLTQYAAGSTITNTSDGHASGNLASISIDNQGRIIGSYTNDVQQVEGQVAVAQFTNAAGLTKKGNSLYQESNNSGTLTVGDNTTLGVSLTTSALEMSNVDIANEFSNMITTQRGFQSNSKIITVSDEMLETLINMKR